MEHRITAGRYTMGCEYVVADHFNIVGLRIAGVSYGRSMACMSVDLSACIWDRW